MPSEEPLRSSQAGGPAAVARIKPPRTGQIDHFDAGYPGLALRVSYGGSLTWVWLGTASSDA